MLPESLFHLDPDSGQSLQKQIQEHITSAIQGGHLPLDRPLPSSRSLASQLKVGRNTVILAYERLLGDGYLIAHQRRGYFVNPDILSGARSQKINPGTPLVVSRPDWQTRARLHPTRQRNIEKPRDWQDYPYPFIYGQLNPELFPLHNWRECCRDAISARAIKEWSGDRPDSDHAMLVEQIRTRLLPRRNVRVDADQILVTVGAQHALYLIAELLFKGDSVIGLENPGYVDVRNIAAQGPATIASLPVDELGLVLDDHLDPCDYIYVTPSHQSPTTATMPLEHRYELLQRAVDADFVLIEDDYESEFNYQSNPLPALKSLDSSDRVLYIGSLSKSIAAGLRVGYVVGPAELIAELRALRRLMLRHPALNNQYAMALFLARGHYDAHIRNLLKVFKERHQIMSAALTSYLPGSFSVSGFGGSSFWVEGPGGFDAAEFAGQAAAEGIIIEPGDIHFFGDSTPLNYFRLGFSAIDSGSIGAGIESLGKLLK